MNTIFKKKLALLVCALLVVTSVPVATYAATVQLNKKTASVLVSKSIKLKVKNTNKKVKWTTSNKKIAAVSKKGVVKGKKVGKAVITAKVGEKKYRCKLTVKAGLNVTKKTLNTGDSFSLKLLGAKKKTKWISSNSHVATVSSAGVVKAVKAGKVVITAKNGKKSYKCTIKVEQKNENAANVIEQTTRLTEQVTTKSEESNKQPETKEIQTLEQEESGNGETVDWEHIH